MCYSLSIHKTAVGGMSETQVFNHKVSLLRLFMSNPSCVDQLLDLCEPIFDQILAQNNIVINSSPKIHFPTEILFYIFWQYTDRIAGYKASY